MAHPNGQPMECDAVEARLLDVVYGELEGGEAASVRAHAAGCESCARSLAKLEGGRAVARKMDTQEPPAAAMSAVLAAAKAKAGENQRAAARARIADAEQAEPRGSSRHRAASREGRDGRERGSWIAEFFRKLGSFATGPQVAMALLLLLMVGIGLWSAPRMTERGHSGTTAVLEPDPDGEAGPSAGALTPAEPLRLEVDPRTDRIVEAGEEQSDREGRTEQRPAIARTSVPAPADVARETPPASDEGSEARVAAATETQAPDRADEARSAEERAVLAQVEGELAPGEGVGGAVEAGALPEPTGAGTSVASVERSAPTAGSVPAAPTAPIARSVPQPSAVPQPSTRAPTDDVESPSVDTTEALAASLHQQAREAGSSGRYAQCVSTYQQVLDRYPTYAQTGRALLEMSECQRRLGQITVAERTLERAQRFATVRADATRRLSTLRAERAAMDRAAGEAAQDRTASDRAAEPASTY